TTNVVSGCLHYRTNIYTATDLCGNTTTRAQLVTWTIDTDTPVFTKCPASTNIGCNPQTIPACDLSPNNVVATDTCSVTITCASVDAVDTANSCINYRTNTYKAFDQCNHTNTCTQVITWRVDTANPTITFCPPDTFAKCGQADPAHTGAATGANGCLRQRTITYTAVDNCNHGSSCAQVVTWTVDTDAPVFTKCPPTSVSLGCNPATVPNCDLSPSNVAATDTCSTPVITCSKLDQTNGCIATRRLTYR